MKKNKIERIDKLYGDILKILSKNPEGLNYSDLISKLNPKNNSQKENVSFYLNELLSEKKIKKDKDKFRIIEAGLIFEGTVDFVQNRGAYFMSDGLEKDVFINEKKIKKALHGDTVRCLVYKNKKGAQKIDVLEIVKRRQTKFVGKLEIKKDKEFGFVIPDNKKIHVDFFISKEELKGIENGKKVLVKLKNWPDDLKNPYGEILEVLGTAGEHNTEIHAILYEYNLPYRFPKNVEDEANEISVEISKKEILKRRDFRDITTFTIDPVDAKDFDDGISFENLSDGKYRIGIHIADVSHYLKPNTKLDDEAVERATSIYLVDRVVPMLPEILSNNVCSLIPNEEKLTFSVVVDIDEEGIVHNKWIGKTIIKSNRRFTYEEAQEAIEGNSKIDFYEELLKLNSIAKNMRKKRIENGAISFDGEEVKFKLDKDNEPTEVYFKISKESNNLIEEFMLLANRIVAEKIGNNKNPKTFVYRIHEEPDIFKLEELSNFSRKLGYKTKINKDSTSSSINKLLEEVKGHPSANMIQTLAVRSMSKAKYSTKNVGHYGLNFGFYTHFTSPIRRYPDVMVHRMLEKYLLTKNGTSENRIETEKLCEHSSQRERLAFEAERDSIKYVQAKYMKKMIGKNFKGIVSGLTEWGIFVEIIENKCEGMISIRDFSDVHVNKEEYLVTIRGKKIKLGDVVDINVKSVNIEEKQINFTLNI